MMWLQTVDGSWNLSRGTTWKAMWQNWVWWGSGMQALLGQVEGKSHRQGVGEYTRGPQCVSVVHRRLREAPR